VPEQIVRRNPLIALGYYIWTVPEKREVLSGFPDRENRRKVMKVRFRSRSQDVKECMKIPAG
jgi:hypothetical protein